MLTLIFSACGGAIDETPKDQVSQESTHTSTEQSETPNSKEVEINTKPQATIIKKLERENGIDIQFSAETYDAENDPLTFKWQDGDTLLSTENSFTKNDLSVGEHTITFTVTDSKGASDTQSMKITILPSNDINNIPTTQNQEIVTDEDIAVSFSIEANDVEDDNLTMRITTPPAHGDIDGIFPNFRYTPDENYRGTDALKYKINDGNSDSIEATVSIVINNINDAPIANAGEDQTIRIGDETNITADAYDIDGTIIKYQWTESNKLLSESSTFNYKPTTAGVHELTLSVTDNEHATTTDTVLIDASNKLPLVIIRIEFNDYKFHSAASVWSDKIFGTDEGELNHYFNEISYGNLQFKKAIESDGTINDGIITVALDENHPDDVDDFPNRIVEAIKLTNDYIDYSKYDTDNNNAISRDELQVMFLVAGGERSTGVCPGIWAHAWCMYGGNAEPPTLDGVKLMECSTDGWYSRFGESHFEFGNDATIGIIAHELGHAALGLPDLYDTDYGDASEGIGKFGLMGSGSWGKKSQNELPGATPTHLTGWSKIASNFVTPTLIENSSFNLEFRGTSYVDYQLYKIMTQQPNEYFLVENRVNSGYDRGLYSLKDGINFTGGLSILHIDDNQQNNDNNRRKLVDVEEAHNEGLDSGLHRGDVKNLYFSGNIDSFTPTTTPNSNLYDGTSSGISVKNISNTGTSMFADIEIQ